MRPSFDQLPLCDRVRQSCRWVVDNARLVTIDDHALDDLAPVVNERATRAAAAVADGPVDGPLDDAGRNEATLVLALDAINFGSGYHDIVRKRPGRSGAQTMADALEDYVGYTGPLSPERLQRFTVVDCSQIFGQDLDDGALEELMSLFAGALVDLGSWLEAVGGVETALDAAGGSAEAFAEALTEMVFYRDVEVYRTVDGSAVDVSFYKRAQITAADLARRVRPFSDLDRLTAFADNLVPHVLRMSGALHIDPVLLAHIRRGELLTPGGRADVELRAAGVESVERLAAATGHRPMDIDEALWTLGGSPEMKAERRPRARTVFY